MLLYLNKWLTRSRFLMACTKGDGDATDTQPDEPPPRIYGCR